ncbi:MAG: ABC transporter permease subunit [Acidobacteriota bacterium]
MKDYRRGLRVVLERNSYGEAAKVLGASGLQVFRRRVLPALAPFTLAQITVIAPLGFVLAALFCLVSLGRHTPSESPAQLPQ